MNESLEHHARIRRLRAHVGSRLVTPAHRRSHTRRDVGYLGNRKGPDDDVFG